MLGTYIKGELICVGDKEFSVCEYKDYVDSLLIMKCVEGDLDVVRDCVTVIELLGEFV